MAFKLKSHWTKTDQKALSLKLICMHVCLYVYTYTYKWNREYKIRYMSTLMDLKNKKNCKSKSKNDNKE